MPPTRTQELQSIVAEGQWDRAAAVLDGLDPVVAADALLALPDPAQRELYARLSATLAARITAELPYYDAYALLRSLTSDAMAAVVDAMPPGERVDFVEALPDDAWSRVAEVPPQPTPVAASVPIIEARGVAKSFVRPGGGETEVIAPLDLAVEPGVFLALLGPSGSGKSTLLRILAGLSEPSSGEIIWNRERPEDHGARAAIVFQSFALFPWLTVEQNVEAPLLARGMDAAARRERAFHTLEIAGLSGFESAYPKELSGGMKQRVGFARALAVEPEVLFMDEPFSALDVLTAENLRRELLSMWREHRIPTRAIFMVTHNIEEAVLLADRIVVLGANPAHIRADFRVPLAYPRDRASTEALLYIDYIYKLMTQPTVEAAAPPRPGQAMPEARRAAPALPAAGGGAVAGLLELVQDRGGRQDLFRVAENLQLEMDDLLPLVEAATLLHFARVEEGDVELTSEGREFVTGDAEVRKEIFRRAALRYVPLLLQMRQSLLSKSDGEMPLDFFRDLLRERFDEAAVERQISTALNWGRYANLFVYHAAADRLALPERHVHDVEAASS